MNNVSIENLSTCENYGISGNCGSKCPKFKDKTCEEYPDVLERLYSELQQENKQLKEQMVKLYMEFKLNNVSTATEHQMICMEDEIHKKEVNILKQQLQQRDSIIEEAIKYIESKSYEESDDYYDYYTKGASFQDEDYDKLLEILNKGKGEINGNK